MNNQLLSYHAAIQKTEITLIDPLMKKQNKNKLLFQHFSQFSSFSNMAEFEGKITS